jgi:hypothetical protein
VRLDIPRPPFRGTARLAVAATYLLVVWAIFGGRQIVDDAFISFRYAEQLAGGAGLVFNDGERVEAYSNLLWVLLLTPFAAAGLDLPSVARLLGLLFTGLQIDLAFRLGARALPGVRWAPIACAGAMLVTPPVMAWSLGGLETPLHGALLAGAILAATVDDDRRAAAWSALLFGLLCISRPEGAMFLGVGAYARWLRTRRPRRVFAWLIVAALPLFAQLAFRQAYYREWLPNSYRHRALWSWVVGNLWRTRLAYFATMLAHNALLVGLAVAAWIRGARRACDARVRLARVGVGLQLGFVLLVGNDWMPTYRHLAPVAPLLALIAVDGLHDLAARAAAWLCARGRTFRISVAALLLIVGVAAAVPFDRVEAFASSPVPWQRARRALARRHPARLLRYRPTLPVHLAWLRLSHDLAEAYGAITVAHDNAGTMFRDRRLRALDFAGLVSREPARIIAAHRDDPAPGCELLADYVFARRPEVIVLWVERNGGVFHSTRRPALGFPLELERHLFDRKEMERDYLEWKALDVSDDDERPGRAFALMVLLRRDLPGVTWRPTP